MRTFLVLAVAAAIAAMTAVTAFATPRGSNGQIAFARFNPALGDTQVWVVNPDGSKEHLVQAASDTGECPRWSPDGARIATCGNPNGGATRIINPDTGSFTDLPMVDPDLFTGCGLWSPDGTRMACESFGFSDPSRNGLYTVRSSDAGGLIRLTSNPGGDDLPGDYSPDGSKFVFVRYDGDGNTVGMFVVNTNGTGLRQIMPAGTLFSSPGSWSPQGNDIVFSVHVTPDVHSSIWTVHSDGSGLHEINIVPANACGGLNSDPAADGCFHPSWSPDGTKVVFAKGKSADFDAQLYTVKRDGSGLTQITHQGVSAENPDWGTHPLTH